MSDTLSFHDCVQIVRLYDEDPDRSPEWIAAKLKLPFGAVREVLARRVRK